MRIWLDPDATLAQIAGDIGIRERAVYLIVRDLDREGFIAKHKVGRRNRYEVNLDRALNFEPLPGTTIRQQITALAAMMGLLAPSGTSSRRAARSAS
jgi:DNA-binding transcriptional regulator PaaX